MNYGEGYIVGIAFAFVLFLLVRCIDSNYYRRKMEILKNRRARLKEKMKFNKSKDRHH